MSESKKFGAVGGKRRAAGMTPAQRSAAASLAAAARWQKDLPTAEWGSDENPLILGGLSVPAYVLSDGRRVLAQRGLQTGIGMSTSGGSGGAHRMARFIESLEAKGLKTNDLSVRIRNPIVFRIAGLPKPAYGYEATIVPDILKAIADAGKAKGMLLGSQRKYVAQSESALVALADKGINTLVDEVTGFRESSDVQQIAKFLGAYVNKEIRDWLPLFQRSFWEQMCRLKGIPAPKENMRMPQFMGIVVNELVYSRIAPGVLAELRSVNPVIGPKGRRKAKFHQFATQSVGIRKVLNLVGRLEGIAYNFDDGDYDAFKRFVDRMIPNYGSAALKSGADIKVIAEAAESKVSLPKATPVPSLFAQPELKLLPSAG